MAPVLAAGKGGEIRTENGTTVATTTTRKPKPSMSMMEKRAWLESLFGVAYFERRREEVVITAVGDIVGVAKVAHRFEVAFMEKFGDVVEVRRELIKEEERRRYQWALAFNEKRGMESRLQGKHVCRASDIDRALELPNLAQVPYGVRVHPYLREKLPTLEVLVLSEDSQTKEPRSHTILCLDYPEVPKDEEIPRMLEEVAPYFQKRPLRIQLKAPAEHIEVRTSSACPAAEGLRIEVLACHPAGFVGDEGRGLLSTAMIMEAEEAGGARRLGLGLLPPPMVFRGVSDVAGVVELSWLPASINHIRIAESEFFSAKEVELLGGEISPAGAGVTELTVELTPKAQASLRVFVFAMPAKGVPQESEEDDVVDWSLVSEDLEFLPQAEVELLPFDLIKDGAVASSPGSRRPSPSSPSGQQLSRKLLPAEEGTSPTGVFASGLIQEGAVELSVSCEGYKPHRQPVVLLVGENSFQVPMNPL